MKSPHDGANEDFNWSGVRGAAENDASLQRQQAPAESHSGDSL